MKVAIEPGVLWRPRVLPGDTVKLKNLTSDLLNVYTEQISESGMFLNGCTCQ